MRIPAFDEPARPPSHSPSVAVTARRATTLFRTAPVIVADPAPDGVAALPAEHLNKIAAVDPSAAGRALIGLGPSRGGSPRLQCILPRDGYRSLLLRSQAFLPHLIG
jgi:hypothetical protein